jgi:hypothetical protein
MVVMKFALEGLKERERERERESKEVREGNLLKDRDGFFCGTFLPL